MGQNLGKDIHKRNLGERSCSLSSTDVRDRKAYIRQNDRGRSRPKKYPIKAKRKGALMLELPEIKTLISAGPQRRAMKITD